MMNTRHYKLLLTTALLGTTCFAQQHEVGLTLGAITGTERTSRLGTFGLGAGMALQANYGYRLVAGRRAALYGEFHFLANPQRRSDLTVGAATRDVATLYLTPGLRLKFRPAARISPYLAGGAGYALYEQSLTTVDGRANSAPREIHRGAVNFGGGADVHVRSWLGLRAEFRDFYTGSPGYNVSLPGGQHNLVASGGFVLKFGRTE